MSLKKALKFGSVLLLAPLFLTACASEQAAPDFGGESESQKQKTVDVSLYSGQPSQSAGLLTLPVILKNTGTNSTVVASRNFTLKIQGHTFKPFKIDKTPADFHMNLSSGEVFNDTLAFYLGTTLTQKQLKKIQLTYEMDNGNIRDAKYMSPNFDQSNTRSDITQNMKSIGDYYSDIKDYIKQSKQARSQGQSPNSLNNQFQDPDYDKFRVWTLINKKDPKNIILQVYNQTNTDIAVPFSDIELVSNSGDELQVDPEYRNNYLCVPHGKFEVITVPLEGKPDMTDSPFNLYVKSSNSGSSSNNFFSTKNTYYPIESVITDASDISGAFTLAPNQYTKGSIQWSKPVLNFKDRTFSCTVELNDLFTLKADRTKYSLVGIDKDGTDGDEEIPKDVQPLRISSNNPTQIDMKFGSLKVLETYHHIELRYDGKEILKVK